MKNLLLALFLCFHFLIGHFVGAPTIEGNKGIEKEGEAPKSYINGSYAQCYICPDNLCYFDNGHHDRVYQVWHVKNDNENKLTVSTAGTELPESRCAECKDHPNSKTTLDSEHPLASDDVLPSAVAQHDPDKDIIEIVRTIQAARAKAEEMSIKGSLKDTLKGTIKAGTVKGTLTLQGRKSALPSVAEGNGEEGEASGHGNDVADSMSLASIAFGSSHVVATPAGAHVEKDNTVQAAKPEGSIKGTLRQGTLKEGTLKEGTIKAAAPSDPPQSPKPTAAEPEGNSVKAGTVRSTKTGTLTAAKKDGTVVAGSIKHTSSASVKGTKAVQPEAEGSDDEDELDTILARLIPVVEASSHNHGHKKSPLEIMAEDDKVDESVNKELSYAELVDELMSSNEENGSINDKKFKKKLIDRHRQIKAQIEEPSKLFPGINSSKQISKWTENEIEDWSKEFKKHRDNILANAQRAQHMIQEVIAVMMIAIEHKKKFKPRDAQVLALLTMVYRAKAGGKEIGRLVQLGTGEGKSILAALAAGFYGSMGYQVDVISTTLLAMRDAEDWAPFFKWLNLTVGSNAKRGEGKKWGPMECYEKDVVYGSIGHFISHTLEDEFFASGTRMGRKYGVLIVDEVDDPAIDGRNAVTKLNSNVPGAEFLEASHINIWLHLHVLMVGKDMKISADKQAVRKALEAYIVEMVKSAKTAARTVAIPAHLYDYANGQAANWAESAVSALEMKNRHDYIIEHNKVKIVDFRNSGIVYDDMHWGDALHEMVIMKEKGAVRMTAEGLTSCFMSNTAYIRRYKENIFGMTGTLGSAEARKFLQKVYPVDVVEVPPYKKKRFHLYPSIIAKGLPNDGSDKDPWIQAILAVTNIFVKTKNRAILIVFLHIAEVDNMFAILQKHGYQDIRKFTRSDNNEGDAVNGKIKPGEIVLATNIGARGTDFTITDELEQKGGLHVCGTFLAENLRIELQMFGRAARQGQRGSGNLVLSMEKIRGRYYYIHDLDQLDDVEEFKIIRDEEEKSQLNYYQEFDHEGNVLLDELFQQFTDMLNTFRFKGKEKKPNYDASRDPNWPIFSQLQEIWGLRYRYYNQKINEYKRLRHKRSLETLHGMIRDKDFPKLKAFLEDKFHNNPAEVFKNPTYLVEMGWKKTHDHKYADAVSYYTKAIKIDSFFGFAALIAKGYAHVLAGEHEYRQASADFEQAKAILLSHANWYLGIQRNLLKVNKSLKYAPEGGHMKQIQNKIKIANLLYTMCNHARGVVEGCLLPYSENHYSGCLVSVDKTTSLHKLDKLAVDFPDLVKLEPKLKDLEAKNMPDEMRGFQSLGVHLIFQLKNEYLPKIMLDSAFGSHGR